MAAIAASETSVHEELVEVVFGIKRLESGSLIYRNVVMSLQKDGNTLYTANLRHGPRNMRWQMHGRA